MSNGNQKHINKRHNKRRANPYRAGRTQPLQKSQAPPHWLSPSCNGCDNLGGGLVDAFYEPYINGEKELRQLNEEYRSHTGLVR